jgi:glycosyltransferase involved in cell wall biosynthesis
LKLLIVFHSLDKLAGGVDNRLSTLEINLPDAIHREFLLFKDKVSLPHKAKINIINSISIPKIIIRHKYMLKPLAFIFGFISLFYRVYHTRRFIKNNSFTTILAVDDYFSLIMILATLGMNIKIVSSVRNSWDKLYDGTMVHLLPDITYKKILLKLMNKYVYKVHCVSDCLANQLSVNYGVNNTISIYNLFDIDTIKELSNEPIEIDYKYIINIGHLNKQKNQKDLIMAYALIKKEGFKEKLLIVGDGEEKNNLIALVQKLNLEDDIVFVGKQNNPYKYLRQATLYVSSSLYEGLPAVLIESLILDIPIVSYNFECGASELTSNTTSLNYNALSLKIIKFLSSESLRHKAIYDGKKLKCKFSKETIIKDWLKVLN